MLGLPTVKKSAKSVRSIEQRSAGNGRGLRAMAPMGPQGLYYRGIHKVSRAILNEYP
jgi:hypothetical protein